MYPGDLRGEDRCAGAASDVNELCEGCVSSSSVRNGSSWALDLLTFCSKLLVSDCHTIREIQDVTFRSRFNRSPNDLILVCVFAPRLQRGSNC